MYDAALMDADYPEWLQGFTESMEDAAAFFADPENVANFRKSPDPKDFKTFRSWPC